MGLESPLFEILQTRAFHSTDFALLAATTLSCCISKILFIYMYIFYHVPEFVGFQTMVILDPYLMMWVSLV